MKQKDPYWRQTKQQRRQLHDEEDTESSLKKDIIDALFFATIFVLVITVATIFIFFS